MKPKLSRKEAEEILKDYPLAEYKLVILGIRGYYKNSMGEVGVNDRNIYDDAIIVIGPDLFLTFNGNTDPSVHRKGVAVLMPGLHLYQKGNHGISKPGGGYPALRPATKGEKLPVWRDQYGPDDGVAINIHRGSWKTTSSLGCQTIRPDQWEEFIGTVYQEMDRYKQKVVPYVLKG